MYVVFVFSDPPCSTVLRLTSGVCRFWAATSLWCSGHRDTALTTKSKDQSVELTCFLLYSTVGLQWKCGQLKDETLLSTSLYTFAMGKTGISSCVNFMFPICYEPKSEIVMLELWRCCFLVGWFFYFEMTQDILMTTDTSAVGAVSE